MSSNPEDYKHCHLEKNTDIEDIYGRIDKLVSESEYQFIRKFLLSHSLNEYTNFKQLEHDLRKGYHKTNCQPLRKSKILYVYDSLVASGELSDTNFRQVIVKKPMKSQSGVLVITVLTSPYPIVNGKKQRFSCQWNCYYCPNEPGQPRSYLHDEPSVLRANQNSFDPILQFTERAMTLYVNGHPVDKVELLILGGTWSSYPMEYREEFIRDLFYAANTLLVRENKRQPLGLSDEKFINTQAKCRIIGVTLETRPDCITRDELLHFRRVGCTRVQLGIQHTDDSILDLVNRQCPTAKTKEAIKLLLDSGFKVDGHFMPQLPGASFEIDKRMFSDVLYNPDLQIDQWKIYPCETTPWTVIKKWADEGKYTPYSDEELIELLLWLKPKVHPWIRLNRVIRDIPTQYILGGVDNGNLRELLTQKLKERNQKCRCIRCREIKDQQKTRHLETELVIREYPASGGTEYFISVETVDHEKILGFIRLRLPDKNTDCIFPALQNSAKIRELHVYGQLVTKGHQTGASQHTGIGKKLLMKAETISYGHGFPSISVIAGVGTRSYYSKRGYILLTVENGEMMMKPLTYFSHGPLVNYNKYTIIIGIITLLVIAILYYHQLS